MSSFLRQIAQYFHGKPDLHNYRFVLPNHRSCKFFERELDIAHNGVYLSPEVMTITDFVVDMTKSVPVNPVEALFILYKCYTAIEGNEDYPFDKFIYWGNVVLNDFDDVDMYLVDAKAIFTNIEETHAIQTTLDDDVREVMKHYFDLKDEENTGEDFWVNYSLNEDKPGEVKKKYLALWQSLYQLYNSYHEALRERKFNSMGGIFREAVDVVKERDFESSEKYVFIGFNMLSTSELAIFKRLQKAGRAMFFWDVASPAFNEEKTSNTGARYVKLFSNLFPEPNDFTYEKIEGYPSIEVVGVPSNVGQAKYCYHLLNKLEKDKCLDPDNAINTAIVLPDKGLLIPLLNSLPSSIEKKNVTMGYPLSSSDIASLMRVVAKMHHQARRDALTEWGYFRNDVKVVLSHPLIKNFFGRKALDIVRDIDQNDLFTVPQSKFEGSELELLFTGVDDVNDTESVTQFLKRFAEFCQILLDAMKEQTEKEKLETAESAENGKDDEKKDEIKMTLQEAFLHQYIEVINLLIKALDYYKVPPCEATVFFLLDRMLATYSIPFEGEPLQGLQVMGMLETRCLDFDNIIILSANDRTLPGKMRSNSFISDFMRANYKMLTAVGEESMGSYYFYRLISRAKKLIMVYDTCDQAVGSSEISRYIPQLEMVYERDINKTMFSLSSSTNEPLTIKMPKTGKALETLNKFREGGGDKFLSASTIKEYISCPLSFYFNKIERLRVSDADADFMDAGTFGGIVHDVLQHLYYPDIQGSRRTGTYKVTKDDIINFENNKLEKVVNDLVDKEYVKGRGSNSPMAGEASIVSVAIMQFAKAALLYDKKLLDETGNRFFEVQECEISHDIALEYGDVKFNFRYIADRIDKLEDGTLRLVDYKTGKDETKFSDASELFSYEHPKIRAILQLILYCNAYALEKQYDGPIMPVVYTLRDMDNTGVFYNGTQLKDYREVNDSFKNYMDEKIKDLFDEKVPFVPTANPDHSTYPCVYCKYKDFCRK